MSNLFLKEADTALQKLKSTKWQVWIKHDVLPLKKRRSTLSTSDLKVTCNPPIMPRVPIAGTIARKTTLNNNISVKLIRKAKILITYLKNKNVSSLNRKKNKHLSRLLCEPKKLSKTTLSQTGIPKTRPISHQQTQIATKESKNGSAWWIWSRFRTCWWRTGCR